MAVVVVVVVVASIALSPPPSAAAAAGFVSDRNMPLYSFCWRFCSCFSASRSYRETSESESKHSYSKEVTQ